MPTKRGGVYFRIDDNHPVSDWQSYLDVFNKYGARTSIAVNPTGIATNPGQSSFLRTAQVQGHEIMDHTPDHAPQYFTVTDPSSWTGLAGVDHVSGGKVCLQYAPIDTTTIVGSGYVSISGGNLAISAQAGGFRNLTDRAQIFFPSLNIICGVSGWLNSDPSNPDTLVLLSAWNDPVTLPSLPSIRFMAVADVGGRMTDAAIKLLAGRSLSLFNQCGLNPPVAWIQPGGPLPSLDRIDIKRVYGDLHQYRSGASYCDRSLKVFDEADPNADRAFAMQWGDFDDEGESLQSCEAEIADGVARHFVLAGLSHLTPAPALGGIIGYLGRLDSLLAWCQRAGIPVKTQTEWADRLYRTPADAYENIIPPINTDNDGNGIPDGYAGGGIGVVDRTDGVPNAASFSYAATSSGPVFAILNLGGVEKGGNDVTLSMKGTPGAQVTLTVKLHPPSGKSYPDVVVTYTLADANWRQYTLQDASPILSGINIPPDVSLIDVTVAAAVPSGGVVKVSGMAMHKPVPIPPAPILSQPLNGAANLPLISTLQWQLASGASDYRLQLSTDSLFAGGMSMDTTVTGLSVTVGPLTAGVKYFWRVCGRNIAGQSPWSSAWAFRTVPINMPPGPFRLLAPRNDTLRGGQMPLSFRWERANDPDGDTLTYALHLVGPGFDSTAAGISDTVFEWSGKAPSPQAGRWVWNVVASDPSGARAVSDTAAFIVLLTSASATPGAGFPGSFGLEQNYPNPFNPSTTIRYALPRRAHVELKVMDLLGRVVARLVDEQQEAGYHTAVFSAVGLSSGVYLYRIKAGEFAECRRLTLLR